MVGATTWCFGVLRRINDLGVGQFSKDGNEGEWSESLNYAANSSPLSASPACR